MSKFHPIAELRFCCRETNGNNKEYQLDSKDLRKKKS